MVSDHIVRPAHPPGGGDILPVSYTHLDVYKRQALLILLAGAYTGLYRVDDSVKELGKTLLIVFALYARCV